MLLQITNGPDPKTKSLQNQTAWIAHANAVHRHRHEHTSSWSFPTIYLSKSIKRAWKTLRLFKTTPSGFHHFSR